LSHHQVLLLFLQLAILLVLARVLAETMKRLGQPPVLGELLAGILLGPSLLGWVWPAASRWLFPAPVPSVPLETISWFGLALLMLLTGLETDVRLLRRLGRAAFTASACGILVPFAAGLALGFSMPGRFRPDGASPVTTAIFFATALSISAMPVIAKILLDLGIIRRNLGVVMLTAAVVDDTIGWILLAVIAGVAAGHGFQLRHLLETLAWLGGFVLLARFAIFPLTRWSLRAREHGSAMPGGEVVILIALTFLCAAATEAIGVHAVFGAFVAGTILRQCPSLSTETVHRVEGVTMAVFAPIFFAAVGLRVDFTRVQGVAWPAIIVGAAIATKVVGCGAGGLLGRLSAMESLVVGLGMSARGAMGLVVSLIGLELGVISAELFAIVVLMALVTSLLAPLTIRPLVRLLPVTDEERARERPPEPKFVNPGRVRMLVPASGGPNALIGCHLAATICGTDGDHVTALYVEDRAITWWRKLTVWRRPPPLDVEAHFALLRQAARPPKGELETRRVPVAGTVGATILAEARKGFDFLVLGASGQVHPLYQPFIADIVAAHPCHVVIVRGSRDARQTVRAMARVLVPTNGGYPADAALQFAAAYAKNAGARLTVFHVRPAREENPLLPARAEPSGDRLLDALRGQIDGQLPAAQVETRVGEGKSLALAIAAEVDRGAHTLVVLGAQNKSIVERVWFGPNIESAIEKLRCTVAVVIPKVAGR